MFEIQQTAEFSRWLAHLRDATGRAAILARLGRLALGNAGDAKPVGSGVSELRIDVGPGYRTYTCDLVSGSTWCLAAETNRRKPGTSRER
jgi:putative addiction module killer protein